MDAATAVKERATEAGSTLKDDGRSTAEGLRSTLTYRADVMHAEPVSRAPEPLREPTKGVAP